MIRPSGEDEPEAPRTGAAAGGSPVPPAAVARRGDSRPVSPGRAVEGCCGSSSEPVCVFRDRGCRRDRRRGLARQRAARCHRRPCCFDLDGGRDPTTGWSSLRRAESGCAASPCMKTAMGRRATARATCSVSFAAPSPRWTRRGAHLVTTRHCCSTSMAAGPKTMGSLVVGVPPDRVMMVALYEESRGAKPLPAISFADPAPDATVSSIRLCRASSRPRLTLAAPARRPDARLHPA